MRFGLYAVLSLAVMVFSSCFYSSKNNIRTGLLVPSESDIPGWIITEDIINMDSSSIGEYNPSYSGMGITSYSECRYRFIDDNDIYIDLKIIKFSNVLNAYGFFSSTAGFREWLSDEFTDEFRSDSLYLKRKGEYVIHVENREALPFLRKEMSLLVKTVDYNIDRNFSREKLPDLIYFLKNFSQNNVIYSKRSLDEFAEIDDIFYSKVTSGKEKSMIFISRRRSFNNAFNIYRNIVEQEKYITVEALERHSAFLKINEKNYRFISVNGSILTGLWECSTIAEGEALLQKINGRINKSETGK